jgi:5-methylthioadenosine/S-adenosylhomocysteine deaminase
MTAPVTIVRGGRVLDLAKCQFVAADILISRGRFEEVGPPGLPAPEGARLIDATGKLIHPGLINSHTHGHGSLSKGMGDRWTLELLLTSSVFTYSGRTFEDRKLSTKLAAAEMALKGCTACYDLNMELPYPTPEGIQAMADAYAEVGIRAVIAPAIADRSFFAALPGLMDALPSDLQASTKALRFAEPNVVFDSMRRSLKTWRYNRDRIRLAIAPTIPMHCSDIFLAGCRDLAEEFGLCVQSHVAESKVQAIYGKEIYGQTIVGHLARLGLINSRFSVAHGVWLTPDDMNLLGEHGAGVAHNPGSNMRSGSGLADARGMLDSGITVGIGTDGANCSDHQNMYEAMRLASLVSKVQGPDNEKWLSTEEVLELATSGSAQVLGMSGQIGRIAPGYHADMVFLEANHVNWLPLNNAINQLVHSEDGTAVHSVMVGGELIVENRRLTRIDFPNLAGAVERARERLERINADNFRLFERLSAVVSRFCPGLAHQHYPVNRYGAWQQEIST